MPAPIAQTNLQLYAQLRRADWSTVEIEAVGRAYALASVLVAGWHRANGKSFLDHFVGTASVTAATGARPAMVRAALVHNAYGTILHPDRRQVGRRQRLEVEQAIGAEAEQLVFDYHRLAWDDTEVAGLLRRVDELDVHERDLTVLRLANEVDDAADLGRLHGGQERLDLGTLIDLASRLGQPLLAEALQAVAVEEGAAPDVEPGLHNAATSPFLRAPRSHRPRLGVALRGAEPWLRRQGRRVAHRLGLR